MINTAERLTRATAAYAETFAWLQGPAAHDHAIALAERYINAFTRGGTVYLIGNGGSAADAAHVAAEYQGRFHEAGRPPLPVVALTTDLATITAVGNDFGYASVFERQLLARARSYDAVVAMSTSGTSTNLLRALGPLHRSAISYVTLVGLGPDRPCELRGVTHYYVPTPGASSGAIQAGHLALQHLVAELVDAWAVGKWAPCP